MRSHMATAFALVLLAGSAAAAPPGIPDVNNAQWDASRTANRNVAPMFIKAQVLLDRARFSPGEIDGKTGDNFKTAMTAFAAAKGLKTNGDLTEEVWQALNLTSSGSILEEYTISAEDLRGPFVRDIPADLEKMKELPLLSYRSLREKLAEKFHMSEELLQLLNPGKRFDAAGDRIVVANIDQRESVEKAARIEVDKTAQVLRVFGRDQKLQATYPATVGSEEKPAPSGRLTVTGISKNPTYRYDPKFAFKGVRATKPFTINPGPNSPVGVVWIGLSSEGYGIHGTPDPSKVGKSESHGCVRLTNWDALRVANAMRKGTPVDFVGNERAARETRAETTGRRKSP
jgi:lipoprotein-anchoring transpeptidase ErfK/SrfK